MCSQKSLKTRKYAGSLLLARHKRGMKLEKSFPGASLSSKIYIDAHTVSQNSTLLQVESTLAELDDICKMATSAALDGKLFHPRIPHTNSGHFLTANTINVYIYADLCKVLGVNCTEDVSDTLIKIKKEKQKMLPL
jgi:hypothetical protein